MHGKGYNAFTLPRLTPLEISDLIEGHNLNIKEQNQAQKKAGKKGKKK